LSELIVVLKLTEWSAVNWYL